MEQSCAGCHILLTEPSTWCDGCWGKSIDTLSARAWNAEEKAKKAEEKAQQYCSDWVAAKYEFGESMAKARTKHLYEIDLLQNKINGIVEIIRQRAFELDQIEGTVDIAIADELRALVKRLEIV